MARLLCRSCYKAEVCQHRFTDRFGSTMLIRWADADDYGSILAMYDAFEPKESAQGLPPAEPLKRAELIRGIVEQSVNVIAEIDGRVVGHAGLMDIDPGIRAELLVVVHHQWQCRGLGTEMISLLIDVARCHGYRTIWLTVDTKNLRAIHVYRKLGFVFAGPFDTEREMELHLHQEAVQ